MTDTIKLTNAARSAIKAALRTWAKENNAKLDTATKSDLLGYAEKAGVDVMALIAAGDDVAPVQTDAAKPEESATITVAEALGPAAMDVKAILDAWKDMDVAGFNAKLANLAARANKPAEIVEKIVEKVVTISAPSGAAAAAAVATVTPPVYERVSQTTVKQAMGRNAFSSRALGDIRLSVWNCPNAPAVDPHYEWPKVTGSLVAQMRHGKPVFLCGPAGTGKSSWAKQLAAVTKRPFFTVSCDNTTDAVDLVGGKGLSDGATVWEDGMLTMAIRVPGAVVLVDEPSTARAGALYVFQTVLAEGELHIKTTGETVKIADGVSFVFADNTNGTGDASGQYVASGSLSYATRDRMGAFANIDYMPADREAAVLVAKVKGCTPALASLLVAYATITRQQTAKGDMTHALGLRRLLSWAELLVDGVPDGEAAELAFLNMAAPGEAEALRQLLVTHAGTKAVKAALQGLDPATGAAPIAPASNSPFAPVAED